MKKIYRLLTIVGILIMIGACGGFESNALSFVQSILMVMLGIGLLGACRLMELRRN